MEKKDRSYHELENFLEAANMFMNEFAKEIEEEKQVYLLHRTEGKVCNKAIMKKKRNLMLNASRLAKKISQSDYNRCTTNYGR